MWNYWSYNRSCTCPARKTTSITFECECERPRIQGKRRQCRTLCNGLFHLQHRGQDAWGTAIQHVRQHTADSCPEVYIDVQKHMGLVRPNKVEAPTASCVSIHDSADLLPTIAGIGHVRYPTNTEFSNPLLNPSCPSAAESHCVIMEIFSTMPTSGSPTVPWPRVWARGPTRKYYYVYWSCF